MYLKRLLRVLGWLLSSFLGQVLNVLSIANGERTISERWIDTDARHSEVLHQVYGDRESPPLD